MASRAWITRRTKATRRRTAAAAVERLEPRSMLATIGGSVQQSIDVAGLTPDDPVFVSIPAAVVQLRDGSGRVIAQQTTNAAGGYAFAGVGPGRHTLAVVPPDGFVGTTAQSLSYELTVGVDDFKRLTFALAKRNAAIAQNLYELLLQRAATADEFAAVVGRLDAGQPVADEVGRIVGSAEFRSVILPVAGFVQAMFPGVLQLGMVRASGQQQRLGIRQDATIQGIMNSQQFVTAHGDTSLLANADYVRFLYQQLLKRGPSANQLRKGVAKLEQGTTRGQLALDVVAGADFQNRRGVQRGARGAVTYAAMLGREPTAAEIKAFRQGSGGCVKLAGRLARTTEFLELDGFTSTAIWDVRTMAATLPAAVQPLSRLKRYNPATKAYDLPVTAGSVTSTAAAPVNVHVLTHGWMPGKEEQVLLGSTPGNPFKLWVEYAPEDQISSTSLAQAIVDADPHAIVIAYSWIDLSATPLDVQTGSTTLTANSDSNGINVGDTSLLSAGMKVTGGGLPAGTSVLWIASPTHVVLSQKPASPLVNQQLTFTGVDLESMVRSLLYVGQSESHTQWAGLMLAEALGQALAPDFFGGNQGLLHLLGESHGSKVVTVATVALDAAKMPVSHLTLLESPEIGPTKPQLINAGKPLALPGIGGGQNFNWRFLQQLPAISKTPVAPGRQATGGTFVENYYAATGFGSTLGGYAGLAEAVDVKLRPAELTNPGGEFLGDLLAALPSHEYPPAWYAQASLQNPTGPATTLNGLSWSPLVSPATTAALAPSYDQFPQSGKTTTGEFVRRQFELAADGATPAVAVESFPLTYALQPTVGDVTDTGSSITLGIGANAPVSTAIASFLPFAADAVRKPLGTGLEFDVSFSGVEAGETVQLVVSAHGMAIPEAKAAGLSLFASGTTGFMTVPLLTLDGGSSGTGPRMATVSLDVFRTSGLIQGGYASAANPVPQLVFSLIGSQGSAASVSVSNMRQFGQPTEAVSDQSSWAFNLHFLNNTDSPKTVYWELTNAELYGTSSGYVSVAKNERIHPRADYTSTVPAGQDQSTSFLFRIYDEPDAYAEFTGTSVYYGTDTGGSGWFDASFNDGAFSLIPGYRKVYERTASSDFDPAVVSIGIHPTPT